MTVAVVVTGVGVVCGVATGVGEFTDALRAGRGAAGPITLFDTTGFAHHTACEVTGFQPDRWLCGDAGLGRAAGFAAAAARMAVRDANVDTAAWHERPGVVCVGTTDGGGYELDGLVRAELDDDPPAVREALARRVPAAALSVAVARELGLSRVEAVTVATACAAGNYAIGTGLDALRCGEADFAVCGGADALSRRNFTGFYRLGLIAPDRCRPFDVDRRGILTGEGAGVMVLETAESAARRGARVYAEVLGYGLACDAVDPLAPAREGIARCMRLALADAKVTPTQVDVISAHGTGTRTNDLVESRAIHDVFGATPPRTVGLKGMLGHTMGAATALAGIACALSIRHGFIPPTVNHDRTDPECALDCVPNHAVLADIRVAQNNGLAFGGNNAVVIFGAPESASSQLGSP
jgi:3-oxoacyl-[acyl-carrier-protein] synthase II